MPAMPAAFERLRERWETMAPREKRLAITLGVTLVVCIFLALGLQIRSRLNTLEARNAQTRNALRLISEHQDEIIEKRNSPDDPERVIPETAQPLQTYLEGIASQAGNMTIPESTEKPPVVKGKYRELSIDLQLRGVTLDQVAKFLKLVETNAPAVVTQRLRIKPFVSAHDKLEVELTIAAYEKLKANEKPKKGGKPEEKSGS
jgi:Type II secretion system (T2SS), protein M